MKQHPKPIQHPGKDRPARIGKLRPEHSLLLNPHADLKLSRCPHCERPTFPRKFALLLHVNDWGFYVQGKTCKYCARCKMILVQQDELEEELTYAASVHRPSAYGSEYFIVGVVKTNAFKASLASGPGDLEGILDHASDICGQYGLAYSPQCWCHKDSKPPVLPGRRPQRIPPAEAGK